MQEETKPKLTIEERLSILKGQAVGLMQVLHVLMAVALDGKSEEDRAAVDATMRDLAGRIAALPKQGANPLACKAGAEVMLDFTTKTIRERLFVVEGGSTT
ncbi:hypothetical protein [Beijerinckia mobilis]|uniref:hypothetical protein n=1 Tax=Beijerinckia mobilis TaxID=231434 RepID=UPI00055794BF|nr:hypothetical protein [Beijerinckia mobilis]